MPNSPSRWLDPSVQGTIFGLVSAVGYTATNALLRSVVDVDALWVSAVKAVPTTLLLGPWLLWKLGRREPVAPPLWPALGVLGAGLIGQVGGNVAFQWALGQVGLAITVPLTLGGMIVASAILARMFLLEPITLRAALALGVLILAIVVLSVGADQRPTGPIKTVSGAPGEYAAVVAASRPSPWQAWPVVFGVVAAVGSGLAYAVLNVAIRNAINHGATMPFTLVTVSLSGIVSLGTLSYLQIGWEGMAATTSDEWWLMFLAGVGNALSFLALTISLRLTSVVYVNALNATQAAMAAFAGVLFFQEALSPWLLLGLALTVAGLLLMRHGRSARLATPEEL